jgi:hypothetical protein
MTWLYDTEKKKMIAFLIENGYKKEKVKYLSDDVLFYIYDRAGGQVNENPTGEVV